MTFDLRDRGFAADLTWGGDDLLARRSGSADWVEGLTEAEQVLVRDLYDSGVAYTDEQVGRLLDALERLGLRGRTLVVLTSDRGEALGEDGFYGHNYLAEHSLRVPLVVELPDRLGAGQVIDRQVRSVDLAPTILEVVGIEQPATSDGRSLLPLIRGDTVEWPSDAWSYSASTNYGLALRREDGLSYRFNNTGWSVLLGREALYDLTRDPGQKVNLASAEKTAPLRREALHRLVNLHRGLRMRLANFTSSTLRGELRGSWVDHARVKSTGTGSACVHWGNPAPFALEPGEEQTLLFENLLPGPLVAEGALDPSRSREAPGFREVFDRGQLTRPEAVVFEDGRWRRRRASREEQVTGLVLWVEGDLDLLGSQVNTDRGLLEQLRALGYAE